MLGEATKQPEPHQDSEEQSLWDQLYEVIWIPVLFAALAVAVTWLVWYFGAGPETAGMIGRDSCGWLDLQDCITASLLDRMFTHGAIASGTGGIVFYLMLTRERQLRESMNRRMIAAEKRADEEREWRIAAERERREAVERERREVAERENSDLRRRISNIENEIARLRSNGGGLGHEQVSGTPE